MVEIGRVALIACAILAVLFCIMGSVSRRLWARLGNAVLRLLAGFGGLLFFNIFGSWLGIGLPVNAITALVAACLGLPGLILLLALKSLLP